MAEGTVVLLNPYNAYAERFITSCYRVHNLRTVALHTSWRERQAFEPSMPVLGSEMIAAHYMVPHDDWAQMAHILAQRGDVVAVIPHYEMNVAPLAQLAADLGLDWAQPDVLPHFRDKASLKALIRRNDPSVRLNVSELVTSPEMALEVAAANHLKRIVLKPNDGGGNAGIGFFSSDDEAGIREHFARAQSPLLLEEYVGGDEYYVDGQTDEKGEVSIFAQFASVRRFINGREGVYEHDIVLHTVDPHWQIIEQYVVRVIKATGLRRSPFHLELKIDAKGPCLIEVGARLVGNCCAAVDNFQHGAPFDAVDIATHHYVSAQPYGPYPVNWQAYDSKHTRLVSGLATEGGRIYELQGLREVEQLDEFVMWLLRPRIGRFVEETRDLSSTPYAVVVSAPRCAEAEAAESRVRSLVRWNVGLTGGAKLRGWARAETSRAGHYLRGVPRPYQIGAELAARRDFRRTTRLPGGMVGQH